MKVITLNKEAFLKRCTELISKLDTQPDIIIGILNGGGYLVNEIKNECDLNFVQFKLIKLQRNENFKSYFFVEFLLKLLPYKFLNKLRVYESNKAKKSIKKLDLRKLKDHKIEFNFIEANKELIKSVLIIDDAIDTGKTMFVVKNNLHNILPDIKIKTAVISWTIENSIVKPDYYLIKNSLVRFPWSKDYKGNDFEKKSFSC